MRFTFPFAASRLTCLVPAVVLAIGCGTEPVTIRKAPLSSLLVALVVVVVGVRAVGSRRRAIS